MQSGGPTQTSRGRRRALGQGTADEVKGRNLRQELLARESDHLKAIGKAAPASKPKPPPLPPPGAFARGVQRTERQLLPARMTPPPPCAQLMTTTMMGMTMALRSL